MTTCGRHEAPRPALLAAWAAVHTAQGVRLDTRSCRLRVSAGPVPGLPSGVGDFRVAVSFDLNATDEKVLLLFAFFAARRQGLHPLKRAPCVGAHATGFSVCVSASVSLCRRFELPGLMGSRDTTHHPSFVDPLLGCWSRIGLRSALRCRDLFTPRLALIAARWVRGPRYTRGSEHEQQP